MKSQSRARKLLAVAGSVTTIALAGLSLVGCSTPSRGRSGTGLAFIGVRELPQQFRQ